MVNPKIDNIDKNLELIRVNLSTLANNLANIKATGTSGGGNKGSSGGRSVSVRPLSAFPIQQGQQSFGVSGELEPTEGAGVEEGEEGSGIEGIKQTTYYIQSATIAMRGYLMLLEKAGLSSNQKKMISELENTMMLIMKISATVGIVNGLMQMTNPLTSSKGIIQLIMAGGYASSSMAYGMKMTGSGV